MLSPLQSPPTPELVEVEVEQQAPVHARPPRPQLSQERLRSIRGPVLRFLSRPARYYWLHLPPAPHLPQAPVELQRLCRAYALTAAARVGPQQVQQLLR